MKTVTDSRVKVCYTINIDKDRGEFWWRTIAEEASGAHMAEVVSGIKAKKINLDTRGMSCTSYAGRIEST